MRLFRIVSLASAAISASIAYALATVDRMIIMALALLPPADARPFALAIDLGEPLAHSAGRGLDRSLLAGLRHEARMRLHGAPRGV